LRSHEVADARLGHTEQFGALSLLQPARRDDPLPLGHELRANPEMVGLVCREPEITEHIFASTMPASQAT
jgi:hypothetical protein